MKEFKGTRRVWYSTTDGEANFYGIATDENWLMRIQQQGELMPLEQEANQKLIASAPEMLEALQNLENDKNQIPAHAWKMVQDAITKAVGDD
jgi:hypothetical protein